MAFLLVRISVGLISIVVILCVKAVEMNAHKLRPAYFMLKHFSGKSQDRA